ncbi:hypothetical protein TWF281_011168 [Arthrobotrys megalospora]
MEFHGAESASPTEAQKLLEWILFAPSPITPILQSQFSTIDVINLSRVCREWRAHLIPHSSESTKSEIQWHPLVRTLAVSRLTTKQEKDILVCRMMRGHIAGKSSRISDALFSGPKHKINLYIFRRVFGSEYLRAITRIYLDGAKIEPARTDKAKLAWIGKCRNLFLLSLRWCSGIDVNDIAQIFVERNHKYSVLLNGDQYPTKDLIPPNLRTLMFWGVDGTWSEDYPGISHEKCDQLMKRYKTDLEWCSGDPHTGGDWATKILFDAAMSVCTVCNKMEKPMCHSCDLRLGIICEGCSGRTCRQCLVLKPIPPTG